jgi:hypothetical protein
MKVDYKAVVAAQRKMKADPQYAALADLVVRVASGGRKAIVEADKPMVDALRVASDLLGAEKAVSVLFNEADALSGGERGQ